MENPEENSWYQAEFADFGEHTQIPQWEEVQHRVITEEEEPPRFYRKPKFQEDFLEGWT